MKMLLIGADGTLGRMLAEHCRDDQVIPATRAELDLSLPDRIGPFLDQLKPEIVVNASAYNDVDGAESQPDAAMAVNATAVGILARVTHDQHIPFVHFSTDYVFRGDVARGYRETDAPDPQGAYALSKRRGEELALSINPETLLIRTSRLYGEWGSSETSKPSFVRRMIELSRERDLIEVVDDEVSSPTYARDLAVATHGLIHAGAKGIFHRTNDGACTWFAFAKAILAKTGWHGTLRPVPGSHFPRPAKRPACSILLTTKLPPLRGWEAALENHLDKILPLIS